MDSKTKLLIPLHIENITYSHVEKVLQKIDDFAISLGDSRKGEFDDKLENMFKVNPYEGYQLSKDLFVNMMYTKACLEEIVALRAVLLQQKQKIITQQEKIGDLEHELSCIKLLNFD